MKYIKKPGGYKSPEYSLKRNCKVCGKEFSIKHARNTICSNECKRHRERERWNYFYHLKKKEYNKKSLEYREKHKERYCIIHGRYAIKSGIRKRIGSKKWHEIRKEVIKRDKYTCQHCGKTEDQCKKLFVHHIMPWKLYEDNSMSNLISFCNSCHSTEERRLNRYLEEVHCV
jgi:5-methylcytosine-specific restriction endonuclease McrA